MSCMLVCNACNVCMYVRHILQEKVIETREEGRKEEDYSEEVNED